MLELEKDVGRDSIRNYSCRSQISNWTLKEVLVPGRRVLQTENPECALYSKEFEFRSWER